MLATAVMGACVMMGVTTGGAVQGDRVVTAPAPEGYPTSTHYKVTVNGRPAAVYSAPVWYPDYVKPFGGPYAFASFDFSGTARVVIEADRPLDELAVRPESRQVRPQVSGQRAEFTLTSPRQISFEPDGKNGPLLLFANPIEKDVPNANDPGVHYFGPGLHKAGKIELKDNETLYLAAGAVVQGGVHATGRNIRIRGRGILDGGPWERWKGPAQFLLHLDHCQNASVEGIILKDAWGWVTVATDSTDVTIRNVKTCSARCENNDGIDIVNSSRVTVSDCFIRSDDDCIAPKGLGEGFGQEPYLPVEDLTVEHCILWTDRANVWRLGCESRASVMHRFRFRDIDVIHYTDPTCPVVIVQPAEDMLMEDVRFENIRIHHEGQAKLLELDPRPTPWAKKQTPGRIRNVLFQDIELDSGGGTIVIHGADPAHPIEGVTFRNVMEGMEKVRQDSPLVSISGAVSNIRFE